MNLINKTAMHLLSVELFLLAIMGSQSDQILSPEKKLAKHMSKVNEFKCGVPQARSFSSDTLLGDTISTAEGVMPPCTVLHRCENSGCCFGNYVCGVNEEEEVERVFKIFNSVNRSIPPRIISVMVTNHTICSCRPKYLTEQSGAMAVNQEN